MKKSEDLVSPAMKDISEGENFNLANNENLSYHNFVQSQTMSKLLTLSPKQGKESWKKMAIPTLFSRAFPRKSTSLTCTPHWLIGGNL